MNLGEKGTPSSSVIHAILKFNPIHSYNRDLKEKNVPFRYIQRFRYGACNSTWRWVDATGFTRYTGLPTFRLNDWSDVLVYSQKINIRTYENWPWMFPGGLYLQTVYVVAWADIVPASQSTIAQATSVVNFHTTLAAGITFTLQLCKYWLRTYLCKVASCSRVDGMVI